jgi:hypothetical protein
MLTQRAATKNIQTKKAASKIIFETAFYQNLYGLLLFHQFKN